MIKVRNITVIIIFFYFSSLAYKRRAPFFNHLAKRLIKIAVVLHPVVYLDYIKAYCIKHDLLFLMKCKPLLLMHDSILISQRATINVFTHGKLQNEPCSKTHFIVYCIYTHILQKELKIFFGKC